MRSQIFSKNLWIGCLITFSCLSACQESAIYEHKIQFPTQTWPIDSIYAFHYNVNDTTQHYDIFLHVAYSITYPYQNLYVTYYLEDTAGALCATALKNYEFFDEKTGKPLGKGFGQVPMYEFLLCQNYRFPYQGPYTLKIEQFMRKDILPGIAAIGLKVARSNKKNCCTLKICLTKTVTPPK